MFHICLTNLFISGQKPSTELVVVASRAVNYSKPTTAGQVGSVRKMATGLVGSGQKNSRGYEQRSLKGRARVEKSGEMGWIGTGDKNHRPSGRVRGVTGRVGSENFRWHPTQIEGMMQFFFWGGGTFWWMLRFRESVDVMS